MGHTWHMNFSDSTPEQAPNVPSSLLSDADLMQRLEQAAHRRRLVDAELAELANEAAYRSRPSLPKAEKLASQNGHPRAPGLVERLTRVSAAEARRLVALGAKTQPRQFMGQTITPEYPHVAKVFTAGEVEPNTALTIIRMLQSCAENGTPQDKLDIADEALAAEASPLV